MEETNNSSKSVYHNFVEGHYKYITICLLALFFDYIASAVYFGIVQEPFFILFGILGLVIHIPLGIIGCWRDSKWFLILYEISCCLFGGFHILVFVSAIILTIYNPKFVVLIIIGLMGIMATSVSFIFGIFKLRENKFQARWFKDYEMLEKE